jgi:hypothetical protein
MKSRESVLGENDFLIKPLQRKRNKIQIYERYSEYLNPLFRIPIIEKQFQSCQTLQHRSARYYSPKNIQNFEIRP